jgi:preprotein translocase SecF subunit
VLHLVKYRIAFIVFSLLVIVPGLIALAVFHLKVGIDFAGGSSIEFRPQREIRTTEEVINALKPLSLQDVQITFGENKNLAGEKGDKTVWVRLNTQIDKNVFDSLQKTLKAKYPKINVQQLDVPTPAGKAYTLLTLTGFDAVPKTGDIKNALSKLPNTSDPTKEGATTPGATPTPQASATAGTKGTATPQASPTANATATPTATATPSSSEANPANIPVRVEEVTQGTTTQTVRVLTSTVVQNKGNSDQPKIQAAFLNAKEPYLQFISISSVGGTVAEETTRNSVLAVVAASLFILLYIWFSFRKVTNAWRYGACAIIAMLHDVLVVLGIFAILGEFFGTQIDALFITALLTVVGFSVHDTIVVFDRIRENMQHRSVESFEDVVNASLIQTMARSLNTSLTVIFTLTALTIFGSPGSSVHTFTLTLLIGIVSGTYSSIFNASMLLVIWEKGEMGFHLFNRKRDEPPRKRLREERELARARG